MIIVLLIINCFSCWTCVGNFNTGELIITFAYCTWTKDVAFNSTDPTFWMGIFLNHLRENNLSCHGSAWVTRTDSGDVSGIIATVTKNTADSSYVTADNLRDRWYVGVPWSGGDPTLHPVNQISRNCFVNNANWRISAHQWWMVCPRITLLPRR